MPRAHFDARLWSGGRGWNPGSCKLLPEPPWAATDRRREVLNLSKRMEATVEQEAAKLAELQALARRLEAEQSAVNSKLAKWTRRHPEVWCRCERPAAVGTPMPAAACFVVD